MVYQHFTVVPGMTVAENLLLARVARLPRSSTGRPSARAAEFLRPRRSSSTWTHAAGLAAGEKQKLEILKQLYLKPRLLILDEPTSVLTPQEADEVLGRVQAMRARGCCTVLIITHKFREVWPTADDVTVLRRGRRTTRRASRRPRATLAGWMVGVATDATALPACTSGRAPSPAPVAPDSVPRLDGAGLTVLGDRGRRPCGLSLTVRAGEIVGVAGVSGNGQRELVEALVGQRCRSPAARCGRRPALPPRVRRTTR
jgi:ABC-type uncharacterized transport system ATPase subunit